MGEKRCEQCGSCCKTVAMPSPGIQNDRIFIDYWKKRGCKVEKDYVIIPYPCPNLDENNLCKIHDKKPLLCKAYKGNEKSGKYGFYVPKGCGLK